MPVQSTSDKALTSTVLAGLVFAFSTCGGVSGGTSHRDASVREPDASIDIAAISCTLSQDGGVAGLLNICAEGPASMRIELGLACSGVTTGILEDAGVTADVKFKNGPCSRAGALGGCQVTSNGSLLTLWYYPAGGGAVTAGEAMIVCSALGGSPVSP